MYFVLNCSIAEDLLKVTRQESWTTCDRNILTKTSSPYKKKDIKGWSMRPSCDVITFSMTSCGKCFKLNNSSKNKLKKILKKLNKQTFSSIKRITHLRQQLVTGHMISGHVISSHVIG